jgi:putative DNA primase/helicase
MSSIPEHGVEWNSGATGQNYQTPTINEQVAGTAPAQITTAMPSDEGGAYQAGDTPQPQLFAVIDGQRQEVPFADLTDEARRLQFKQLCEEAEEPVTLHATEFFAWPDNASYPLLKLVKELGDHVRLQIGDDEEQYRNVFEAVMAAFPASPEHHTAAQRTAIVAAAVFLAEGDWPAAANTITDALAAIDAQSATALDVFKLIRNVAGTGAEEPAIAAHYHGCLQIMTRVPEGEPALRYFRDDFYAWNERTWERVDDKELKARVTRHIQQEFGGKITDTLVNNVILNLKGQTLLNAGQLQIPFWIESESPLVTASLPLVVFQNGIVDIDDGMPYEDGWCPPRLYQHDPRCFSTVMLPYEYDPLTTCPLWEQTLAEILPCEQGYDNRVLLLQEFMGLTLFPNQMRHEKFLIMVGHGANGKSTVLRVWERMLGSQNVSHVPLDALGSEFRLYDMMGKLANIASDMKRMDKMEEGRLKELVSGEPLQVNRKFKAPVTMVPTARLIFATNELPPINDRSDGIWRRMIAMPFTRQFGEDERDLDRSARLMAELPGIFNWALEGAVRLFGQRGFTRCRVCEQCAGEHRQHSDSFLEFMDEMVEVRSDKEVSTDEFYRAYVDYCENNGRRPKSNTEVGKQVLRLGGVSRKRRSTGDRKYEYRGIGLRFNARLPFNLGSTSSYRRPMPLPPISDN